jgi:hypothetical protein
MIIFIIPLFLAVLSALTTLLGIGAMGSILVSLIRSPYFREEWPYDVLCISAIGILTLAMLGFTIAFTVLSFALLP